MIGPIATTLEWFLMPETYLWPLVGSLMRENYSMLWQTSSFILSLEVMSHKLGRDLK